MRRSIGILVATLITGCIAAVAAHAADPLDLLPVLASANGTTLAGTHQGYCVDVVPLPGDEDEGSVCVDVSAPTHPPPERLALRRGDLVDLRFQDNPRISDDVAAVAVVLGRVDDEGFHPRARVAATRVPGTADRWAVRPPVRTHDDTLEVEAGFVSFLVGVRERRAR